MQNTTGSPQSSGMRQEEKLREVSSEVQHKVKQTQEQLRHLASKVDHTVHSRPWPVIAGVAVGCLFLGFMCGVRRR